MESKGTFSEKKWSKKWGDYDSDDDDDEKKNYNEEKKKKVKIYHQESNIRSYHITLLQKNLHSKVEIC